MAVSLAKNTAPTTPAAAPSLENVDVVQLTPVRHEARRTLLRGEGTT